MPYVDIKLTTYKPADLQQFIGKRVRYLEDSDIDKSGRGYLFFRYGIVDKIEGKNIYINDSPRWIPDFRFMEVHKPEESDSNA